MELTLFNWLLAFSPVIVVLILMLGFRWGGSKAGAIGWLVAIVVAWLRFGAGFGLIVYTQSKGAFLTLDCLYIVWTTLLFLQGADDAGSCEGLWHQRPPP